VVADPSQVVGDAGAAGGAAVAVSRAEGDHTHETGVVVGNHGAAGVAAAGSFAVGVAGAQVGAGYRSVRLLALAVADNLDVHALQPIGQVSIVHATPSALNDPGVLVAFVLLVHAWQGNLVDQAGELHAGSADQTNVSAATAGPVGVADEVVAADGLPVGTVPAPVGTVVNLDVVGGQAMSGGQDPVVGNDGTSTNSTAVAAIVQEEQTHDVGSLALGRWVAVHDATLGTLGEGHLAQQAGAVEAGRGARHQGQGHRKS